MKTITSEKRINSNSFKIKIGTLDKKNPTTMYIDAGTYILPKEEKESYKHDIASLERHLRTLTRNTFKAIDSVSDDFLLVTDVALSRISTERTTHFTIQLYFNPIKEDKTTFSQLCKQYTSLGRKYFSSYKEIFENHGFFCQKTKCL